MAFRSILISELFVRSGLYIIAMLRGSTKIQKHFTQATVVFNDVVFSID